MKHYSDEALINGILKKDNNAFNFIYENYFGLIKNFVIGNNGNKDDAYDLFQNAQIVIYRKLKTNNDFKLTSSFSSFLFGICRFLWLKELEKARKHELDVSFFDDYTLIDDNTIAKIIINERQEMFQYYFQQLSSDCQKVILMSLEKISYQEIAEKMGYKSENYAKNSRYRCKERLVKMIKNDPNYKNIGK